MDALTADDIAWLRGHQHRKLLDPRVQLLGVAARGQSLHPLVLKCYPLRVTAGDPSGAGDETDHEENATKTSESALDEVTNGEAEVSFRADEGEGLATKKGPATARVGRHHKGGNKWQSQAPVPWPNLFWLVCPELCRRVGRLEHRGYVRLYQQMLHEDEVAFSRFREQQREYAALRWSVLSESDRQYCEKSGLASVLRDTGVAGIRFPNQVKCLHTHVAHALAMGSATTAFAVADESPARRAGSGNIVGEWALAALERGEDTATAVASSSGASLAACEEAVANA